MGIFDNDGDFNKYRVFYAVGLCKSFSKATEYLHISQPAVSYAIKDLESQLNTKLFIRNNKSVTLTEAGEKLMYYVSKAFDNINMGERILKEDKEDLTGIIRIGIYTHISLFMLPDIINKFSKNHPNAKFYIYATSNQEMVIMLKNNELDFLIMQYPIFIRENTFKEEIICELENCFYANRTYYDKYVLNNDLLLDFPLILPSSGYSDINSLEQTLKSKNMFLKNNFTSYATELSIELALKGVGVAWGLKKCVEKYVKRNELYELPVSFKLPTTKFSIAYDSNFLNKTTKEFINFFREEIGNVIKKSN